MRKAQERETCVIAHQMMAKIRPTTSNEINMPMTIPLHC